MTTLLTEPQHSIQRCPTRDTLVSSSASTEATSHSLIDTRLKLLTGQWAGARQLVSVGPAVADSTRRYFPDNSAPRPEEWLVIEAAAAIDSECDAARRVRVSGPSIVPSSRSASCPHTFTQP